MRHALNNAAIALEANGKYISALKTARHAFALVTKEQQAHELKVTIENLVSITARSAINADAFQEQRRTRSGLKK
jgi:hypothetical protein